MSRFDGRVAVITGAGSGLGREFSLELAKDGARIVVADVNLPAAEDTVVRVSEQGGTAVAVHVDVADAASVEAMVANAIDTFGGIDILVNNAGLVGETLPTHEVSEESWDRVMSVDMKGVFLGSRAVIPTMLEKGSGVIINIASVSGFWRAPPGSSTPRPSTGWWV